MPVFARADYKNTLELARQIRARELLMQGGLNFDEPTVLGGGIAQLAQPQWSIGQAPTAIQEPGIGAVQFRGAMRHVPEDVARRQLMDEDENARLLREAIEQSNYLNFPKGTTAPQTLEPFTEDMLSIPGVSDGIALSDGGALAPTSADPRAMRFGAGSPASLAMDSLNAQSLPVPGSGATTLADLQAALASQPVAAVPAAAVDAGLQLQPQEPMVLSESPIRMQRPGVQTHSPAEWSGAQDAIVRNALQRGVDPSAALAAYQAELGAARDRSALGQAGEVLTFTDQDPDFLAMPSSQERMLQRLEDSGMVLTDGVVDRQGRFAGGKTTSQAALDAEARAAAAPYEARAQVELASLAGKTEREAQDIVRKEYADKINRFSRERAESAEVANAIQSKMGYFTSGSLKNSPEAFDSDQVLGTFVEALRPLVYSGDPIQDAQAIAVEYNRLQDAGLIAPASDEVDNRRLARMVEILKGLSYNQLPARRVTPESLEGIYSTP